MVKVSVANEFGKGNRRSLISLLDFKVANSREWKIFRANVY